MSDDFFPKNTDEFLNHRHELTPEISEAFEKFSDEVFSKGALPEKTQQLIAVAVAHVTQCPYCIRGHIKLAGGRTPRPRKLWRLSG